MFSLSVIRSLGSRDIEIIAGDELPITPGSLSRHTAESFTYPNVVEKPDAYLDVLEQTIRKYKPAPGVPYVFLPMQSDTGVVADHCQRFERWVSLALADGDVIRRLSNKRLLVEQARRANVKVPRTWLFENGGELASSIDEIELPAFVKRPDGSGGVGIAQVHSREELNEAYLEIEAQAQPGLDTAPFVQAHAPGTDYCFSAIYAHGERIASMSYEVLASYPRNKGPGAIRRTIDAPELEEAGHRLLQNVGWHGVIELDFRWEGQPHTPYLIEANPRFFGGTFLGTQAGTDYPWLAFQIAQGIRPEPQPPAPGGYEVETPILGLLAILEDLVSPDVARFTLQALLNHVEGAIRSGGSLSGLLRVLGQELKRHRVEREHRLAHVRGLIERYEQRVLELIDKDDPMPILGLVYPLAIFIEHGEITPELMVGAGGTRSS